MLWTTERLGVHRFRETYLVEPIIPQGGIVFLSGKRGIGKSHIALTIAACLEGRGALFGLYHVRPTGPVVYIQADMPAPIQQERIQKAWSFGYVMENVYWHFPKFFNLLMLSPSTELVKEINALSPCLIVWDTLRKIHRGSSNDDDTPSLVYGHAQGLFPTATHLFIHHEKKTVVEQEKLEIDELFRGSGAWLDDADTGFRLSEVAPGRLLLENTKHRTCEAQAPIHLSLNRSVLLLYASSDRLRELIHWWKRVNPNGTEDALERFLLHSFVGSPRLSRELSREREPVVEKSVHEPDAVRVGT